MTPEEQQKEQERLAAFRAEFQQKMAERQQQDAQQMSNIGRDYGDKLPDAQTLENDFDADSRDLQKQNKAEREEFKTWMEQQREAMRADDATQQPDKAAPRYVPTFALGQSNSYAAPSQRAVPDFAQKEAGRERVANAMEKEFENYQSQTHAERLDVLHAKRDDNLVEMAEAQRQQQKPPSHSFETDSQYAERLEAVQNAEVDRIEHARTNGSDSFFMQGASKMSFENSADYEKRMADAVEYAKQQQENEREKTITR